MTMTNARSTKTADANGLVEMAWDPITRIVGSLGIYTKIDFGKGVVAECQSTSSIFRGYSIFMKGKDRETRISSQAASAAFVVTITPCAPAMRSKWPTECAHPIWGSGL